MIDSSPNPPQAPLRVIEKLPKWVWIGASAMASVAGMINAVTFMGAQHQGVSHLTGTTTMLGISISEGSSATSWHLFGILASFLVGAALSGFIIRDSTLRLGRRYGVALSIEAILLFAAVPLFSQHSWMGEFLASAACGLQNGMVSTYSGAVLRTTHVSGAFTDLGIYVGHLLAGTEADPRRMRLIGTVVGSFFAGGLVGAFLFRHFGFNTLLLPAFLTGIVGGGYTTYRHYRVPK